MRVSILTVAIASLVLSTHAAPIGRHYGPARGYRHVKARGMAPTPAAVLAPRQAADDSEVASEVPTTTPPPVESAVAESSSSSEVPLTDDQGIMEDQYPVIEPTDATGRPVGKDADVAYNNLDLERKQGAAGQPECQPCTAEVCAAVCIPVDAEESTLSSQSGNTVTVTETITYTEAVVAAAEPTSTLASDANGDVVDEGRSELPTM